MVHTRPALRHSARFQRTIAARQTVGRWHIFCSWELDCTGDTKQLVKYLLRFHSTRAARRMVGGGSFGAACRAAHSSRWPSRQSARCAALFAAGLYLAL